MSDTYCVDLANATLLHKWTDILFKIIIASVVFNLITNLMSDGSAIRIVTNIVESLINIAYGCVLVLISKTNKKYFISGIALIAYKLVYLFNLYIIKPEDKITVLAISLGIIVVGMWGEYNEFIAHAEVLANYDEAMSDKWVKLWNWYIISMCVTIGGLFLSTVISLIATIVVIVISILKIIYLRKTKEVYELYIIKN